MDDELKRHIAELEGKVRTLRELNGHLMLERDDAIDVAMNTENENDTLRARIAELEARWAEVPWKRMLRIARRLIGELLHQGMRSSEIEEDYRWLAAHAPKEAAE